MASPRGALRSKASRRARQIAPDSPPASARRGAFQHALGCGLVGRLRCPPRRRLRQQVDVAAHAAALLDAQLAVAQGARDTRSEEHTTPVTNAQLVCRLLLEKTKRPP